MSSTPWINVTPRLRGGVEVMNKTDNQKFLLLLNRLVQEILAESGLGRPFDQEQMDKLMLSLSLDHDELCLLLDSSVLILLQAMYGVTKPAQLEAVLTQQLGLEGDKAAAFSNTWKVNASKLIEKLKEKCIYKSQVQEVSWLVNVQTASDQDKPTFQPRALLQLKTLQVSQPPSLSTLNLDMNETQLFTLFNALENVQLSLDSLQ